MSPSELNPHLHVVVLDGAWHEEGGERVFTIPKMLRIYFLHHRELLGAPSLAAYETVKELMVSAVEETAREVALDDLVHETPPEAVAALEALLPRALDPLVE